MADLAARNDGAHHSRREHHADVVTITICQPPHAVSKKPALDIPPLSCDCHAHILGPRSDYPYVANGSDTPPDALPSDCLRMLDTLGIQRMVVVQASCYGEDNRRTIDAGQELG